MEGGINAPTDTPDAEELVLRWAPIPGTAQEAFFDDDTPDANLLFRGGWGSGKTMTVTAKALKLSAINAPLPGIWTVPDYNHVEDTIIPMLEEPDSETGEPWFLGVGDFSYSAKGHVLTWRGGGPIHFQSAENPDSIAGPNMAFAVVDEPGAITYKAWRNTVARVRHVAAPLRQKVAAGTNEDLGWLSEMFGADRAEHCHVFQMSTRENSELLRRNPNYLREVMANATEAEVTAYIEGGVANLTGALAYPMFHAETHWAEDVAPADPTLALRVSFDFNVDPMVCILGQHRAGPYGVEPHVVDAITLYGGSTVDQTCEAFLERYPRWPAGLVVYGDATGKDRHVKSLRSNYDIIREKLQQAGPVTLKVPLANPPVARRLNSVNRLLKNALGQTRLWIRKTHPAKQCATRPLVQSLERTQKKSGTDDILKKSGETITHAGEALGYWVDYEWPAQKPATLVTMIGVSHQDHTSRTLAAIRARKHAANLETLHGTH